MVSKATTNYLHGQTQKTVVLKTRLSKRVRNFAALDEPLFFLNFSLKPKAAYPERLYSVKTMKILAIENPHLVSLKRRFKKIHLL